MDIREHLQAELKTVNPVTGIDGRVFGGKRPQGTALPCLVWRCTKYSRGEDLVADTGERTAHFEIVVWAGSLEATLAIKAELETRYHGTAGYEFGGRASPEVDPIEMGSSRLIDEYDGDRVSDTYDENGAFPLTTVFEFMWDE